MKYFIKIDLDINKYVGNQKMQSFAKTCTELKQPTTEYAVIMIDNFKILPIGQSLIISEKLELKIVGYDQRINNEKSKILWIHCVLSLGFGPFETDMAEYLHEQTKKYMKYKNK